MTCSEQSSLSFVGERIAQEGMKREKRIAPGKRNQVGSGLVGGDGQGDTQCAVQT